ncbi:hypothetical protein MY8738_004716 [Beauveria namnaoensis]
MSTPAAQPTEALHLSDGLCKNWEQEEKSGSDIINRYFAALPDIHTHYQSKGVPSHLPPKDGLMQGHGYAKTRPGVTAATNAQVNAEFIYISRKIDPAKPFDGVPVQWTELLRVEKRPRDIDTTDEPLKDAEKYLATGYSLLKHYTDADLKSGDLFCGDGKDPRAGSSTGHIPVYTRPSRTCLGWGGYDEFLFRQEAGRTLRKDMVKEDKWNVERDTTVKFVNNDGKVVSTVPNNIPQEHFPHCHEPPVPLYDQLHGQRRGFQRGPETEEAFITRKPRPLRKN